MVQLRVWRSYARNAKGLIPLAFESDEVFGSCSSPASLLSPNSFGLGMLLSAEFSRRSGEMGMDRRKFVGRSALVAGGGDFWLARARVGAPQQAALLFQRQLVEKPGTRKEHRSASPSRASG